MKTTSLTRQDLADLSSGRMRHKGAMTGISLRCRNTRTLLTESLPCEEKALSTIDRIGKILDSLPHESTASSIAAIRQAKQSILSIH